MFFWNFEFFERICNFILERCNEPLELKLSQRGDTPDVIILLYANVYQHVCSI